MHVLLCYTMSYVSSQSRHLNQDIIIICIHMHYMFNPEMPSLLLMQLYHRAQNIGRRKLEWIHTWNNFGGQSFGDCSQAWDIKQNDFIG